MKYEVLKRSHLKRNIIIALIVVGVISAIILNFTRAKYRTTESIPLIQGTINFSPSDFNILAFYLNKGTETISADKAPHVGYTLNTEQSTCEVNDKDAGGEIVYEDGNLSFMNMNYKGTKCSVYFDLIPDSDKPVINTINSSSDNDTSVTIELNATDNIGIYYYYYKLDNEEEIRTEENSYTFEELEKNSVHTITVRVEDAAGNVSESQSKEVTIGYKVSDIILSASPTQGQTTDWTNNGQGITYYYTGANPNNWVQFAGFWWRIIRINGDGSIRMIYQGTSANTTGTGTQIGTSAFNSSPGNKTYVGLVYNTSSQHGDGTNSTIMNKLNTWYNNNLASYEADYIDTGAGFCSDRNMASGYNFDSNGTIYYAPYNRYNGPASLQCNSEDILSQDNEKLPNPIGLVTMDEALLTGIKYSTANTGSYLYTGQSYWTMSPYYFNGYGARVFTVWLDGNLYDYDVDWTDPGVRPVINIRANVSLTGSGTSTDPFKVVGA